MRFAQLIEAGLVAVLCLLAALFLLRTPVVRGFTLELGASDRGSVSGFHQAEINADDEALRWTDGAATLRLPAQGLGAHVLRLRLSAPQSLPPDTTPATVRVGDQLLATLALDAAPRQYNLLLPPPSLLRPAYTIGISSTTFVPPRDERALGVAVFVAQVQRAGDERWLYPVQVATLSLATVALWLALRRLGVDWLPTITPIGYVTRLLVVALFVLISLAMRQSDVRFVERWSAVSLTAALAVGFVVVACLPAPAHRHAEAPPDLGAWWRTWAPAGALYAGLTALLFLHLWPGFAAQIFGAAGDNFEYAWKLQWFVDALVGRGQSPTFVPQSFYPAGYELGMSEITPAHTLLGLPLTLAFGPALSFNVLLFASFVLTALVAAMYAERIGAPRLGALVAGVGVSFCVYRYAHMAGLLPQMSSQWVLLALYGWEGFLQRRRLWDAVLAAVGLALAFWSSLYYGATLVPLLALYTLLRRPWAQTRTLVEDWRALLAASVIVVALVAPYAQPFIQAQAINEQRRFTYETLLILSALPSDLLSPNAFHPLRALVPLGPPKHYVALGVGLTLLACLGLWRHRRVRVAWALALIGLINVALTLGPELRLGTMTIPLPARWMYEYVPVLQSIRAWSRMAFYTQIAVAALAALAFVGWRAWPLWRRTGMVALAALVLFEVAALPSSLSPPLAPRPVDRWLATQPGGAVIQVPDTIEGYNVYYSLHHGHPITVGYGTYFPPFFHENISKLVAFPLPFTIPLYQQFGTEYVLVRRALMPAETPWRTLAEALPDTTLVYEDEEYTVYRVRQLQPPWR